MIGFGATALHNSQRSQIATAISSSAAPAVHQHVQQSCPVGDTFTRLGDRRSGIAVRQVEHRHDVVGRGDDEPRAHTERAE